MRERARATSTPMFECSHESVSSQSIFIFYLQEFSNIVVMSHEQIGASIVMASRSLRHGDMLSVRVETSRHQM